MIKTLVFDWDGTLHNTEALYGSAFRAGYQWLVEHDYAQPRTYTDREVSAYLGMNAKEMWQALMPDRPSPVQEHVSALVGQHMVSDIRDGKAALYPGALETLAKLKRQGLRLVLLSNCQEDYMAAHREVFGLDRFFDSFYCCQTYDYAPKWEIFLHIQRQFPAEFVLIGDRYGDLEPAYLYHYNAIGCAYGFGQPEELAGADAIAKDVREIPGLLRELM